MISLPAGYKIPPVSELNREISLICWGFTIGFGVLTSRSAWKHTRTVNRKFRLRSVYIWALWADIIASLGFGFGIWFYMQRHVAPGLPLFLMIVFFWSIQMHSQLQILLNRLSMIMSDKTRATRLRWSAFIIIFIMSIIVGATWIPAVMEIAPIYRKINKVLGRTQKIIYLIIDGSLNYYYVRTVNRQMVELGLTKFEPLVKFNTRIAALSVGTDLLLVGMMNYPDPYVSNEFTNSPTCTTDSCELGYYSPEDDDSDNYNHNSVNYGVSKPVAAVENQEAGDLETGSQTSSRDQTIEFENDEQPLHLGVGEIEVMTSDRKN